MASFLESQLDFIYFFYGLSVLLLGALCLVISKERRYLNIRLLGLFGCLHGSVEWLESAAVVISDARWFAVVRAVLLVISFLCLAEFARRGIARHGVRIAAWWIYAPVLVVLIVGVDMWGLAAGKALARYLLCIPGALGAAAVIIGDRDRVDEGVRPLIPWIAAGFVAYAASAGLIGEVAPFWPADSINQAWFFQLTGIPIQLVRALIATALAAAMWGAWGQRLMRRFNSPRYSGYLKRQFVGLLATMAAILMLGWVLTDFFGNLHRAELESEASGDSDLLIGRMVSGVGPVDAVVRLLAQAPAIKNLLIGGDDAAQSVLDSHVTAAGAKRGMVLDTAGRVLDSSDRREHALLGTPNQQAKIWFDRAVSGGDAHEVEIDPAAETSSYVSSYPVRSDSGTVIGVVVLERALEPLAADLRTFDQPFFLIDARGLVVITNQASELLRALWPQPNFRSLRLDDRIGGRSPTLLTHEVFGSEWTSYGGRRAYVLRRQLPDAPLWLVVALPMTGLVPSRLLGIIITLQVAITALFYFFGRERGVRDRVHHLRRIALQDRARVLARQAATDPLTGLYNRLRFNERLHEEFIRWQRNGRPFALILYDVDHFKEVNDLYGHPVGDQVLVKMSRTVVAALRRSDMVARWGGEEFVVLLDDTDVLKAAEVAEKLRLLIAHMTVDHIGIVTASFGVAQVATADTSETLMSRVDNALYRAKLNGRNRVEIDAPVVESAELSPAH